MEKAEDKEYLQVLTDLYIQKYELDGVISTFNQEMLSSLTRKIHAIELQKECLMTELLDLIEKSSKQSGFYWAYLSSYNEAFIMNYKHIEIFKIVKTNIRYSSSQYHFSSVKYNQEYLQFVFETVYYDKYFLSETEIIDQLNSKAKEQNEKRFHEFIETMSNYLEQEFFLKIDKKFLYEIDMEKFIVL